MTMTENPSAAPEAAERYTIISADCHAGGSHAQRN